MKDLPTKNKSCFQLIIDFVCNCLQPFIRCIFSGAFHCQMAEPAVRLCAVPVLDFCRNGDYIARLQAARRFAFFLIPSFAIDTNQNLSAAGRRMMNVPIVAALNWTPPPQSLVVASFNGIHICALCESFLTSSFYQVIFLFLPRSKPLLQG